MIFSRTSEIVFEAHPEEVSDQISYALIDNLWSLVPNLKVAYETLVTTGQVVVFNL